MSRPLYDRAFDAAHDEEPRGFDPADRPQINPEMRETILVRSAMSGTPLSDAYYLLFPEDKPSPEDQAMEANAAKGTGNKEIHYKIVNGQLVAQ